MAKKKQKQKQKQKEPAAGAPLAGAQRRRAGPRPPRLSRHKKRAAWFFARVTWPKREAARAKLVRERRRAARMLPKAALGGEWTMAGPTNIGGRATSLIVDPRNADRIWIGAAGGGVWRSADAGRHWQLRWKAGAPLEIGALAVDPSRPDTLYCGTGEANLSADSYPGDGVYRSTNGGASWKVWALSAKTGLPKRIGAIAVDPADSGHVMVGGIGYGRMSSDDDFGGLYETKDGGRTWERLAFVSPNNYWCHAVLFDAATPGRMFASITGPGMASGIYRSMDGGATWTQLRTGLPSPDRIGRAAIAIAPSNPGVVYAIAADMASADADRLLGVFRSANGGNSWKNVAGPNFRDEGQISYNCTIAVHPSDADHVICGGVDLHVTTDAGVTWRRATKWDADRGGARYGHADHHQVVMPATAPGRVYSANDGGMDASEDGGAHWDNRSNGLATNMFYDIDVAQTDPKFYGGGAQDNGTLVTNTGAADAFFEFAGGDGGWMVIDPKDAGHVYASSQYGAMYRLLNGRVRDVSPPFRDEDSGGIWMVYIAFDPNAPATTVYTGNQRVYRTKNDGVSWDALTPVLDGSPISAIEVALADSKAIYVGTENGGLFRSLDGGATWSANLAGPELPGVMITRIETHPARAREVYLTLGNFGNRHVFRSTDAGSTWSDIDGGRLPDAPHHALLIRPDKPAELYVCSDAGVHMTSDGGATWRNATGKLPNAMIVDLVYRTATKTLLAATYGRSLWSVRLP